MEGERGASALKLCSSAVSGMWGSAARTWGTCPRKRLVALAALVALAVSLLLMSAGGIDPFSYAASPDAWALRGNAVLQSGRDGAAAGGGGAGAGEVEIDRNVGGKTYPTAVGPMRLVDASICPGVAAKEKEARLSGVCPAELIPLPRSPSAPKRLRILSFFSHASHYEPWADGYGGAMAILKTRHDVEEHNWQVDGEPDAAKIASFSRRFDFILVKSNWHWFLDIWVRKHLHNSTARLVLIISGTEAPPDMTEVRIYHTLFYEVSWYFSLYCEKLVAHGRAYKAFGINTDIMNTGVALTYPAFHQPRPFDFTFVGSISAVLKRVDVMAQLPGHRLIIGHKPGDRALTDLLTSSGALLSEMTSYRDLASLLRMSAAVVVPTPIYGGGERATLEARACGAKVWIAEDNVKLRELLCGPIPSHIDYVRALEDGLYAAFS